MLSHVGPDWGFCVAAPPTDGKDWLPQVLLVVRVVRGDDAAPVDEALLSAVSFTARWAVLSYNHDHPGDPLSLKSVEYNHQEIHYLVGDRILPPGFQPAYGLASGWLVFGSAPDVVHGFANAKPKTPPADGSTFPLLRVSVKACAPISWSAASLWRPRWRRRTMRAWKRRGDSWTKWSRRFSSWTGWNSTAARGRPWPW